jgi:protocatechuate 3,4-dioxygenase alpha subunit
VAPDAFRAITIGGIVLDGDAQPVPDALIETWSADREGRFADLYGFGGASAFEGFRGFARAPTDDDGGWEIVTFKPGAVDGAGAPHIAVSVFARGLLHRVVTRIYFADEAQANATDPVLARVPAERRATLIAEPSSDGYRFDIRLQGSGQTVFFAV